MKKKISFAKLFSSNRFCMIFSIVLAVIIWFTISVAVSPTVSTTISDVPVNIPLENTSFSNLKSYGNTLPVDVVIQGKRYVTAAADASDIKVNANIGSIVGAGMYTLELSAQKNSGAGDFEILAISPSTIAVRLDYEMAESFELDIETPGVSAASDNLTLTRYLADATKQKVTITGPKSEVSSVKRVAAYCADEVSISKTTAFTASIKCYDSSNNEIDLLYSTVNYNDAGIVVAVERHKLVPLTVEVINGPVQLPPYKIYEISGDTRTEIKEITVQGEPEAIENLQSLTLGTIDFSDINATDKLRYEFSLPQQNDISYPEYNKETDVQFEIVFEIKKIYTKTVEIKASDIRFSGVLPGLNASSQSAVKGLVLASSSSNIKKITSQDVIATVDCTNLTVGSHGSLRLTFSIKDDPNCWAVGEYTVTIKIS